MSTLSTLPAHQSLLATKIVPLYFIQQNRQLTTLNFTLTEAILQFSSAVFTVSHTLLGEFTDTEENVFFVVYNSFNDLFMAMLESSAFYVQELLERASQKNTLLLILFISSLVTVCLSIPILIPAVGSVNKTKDKVLSLFFEIPSNYVIQLETHCEAFLASLHADTEKEEDRRSVENNSTAAEEANAELYVLSKEVPKQPRRQSSMGQTFIF